MKTADVLYTHLLTYSSLKLLNRWKMFFCSLEMLLLFSRLKTIDNKNKQYINKQQVRRTRRNSII